MRALRESHTGARIARDASVLDCCTKHLAEDAESVLDNRSTGTVSDHRRYPGADRRSADINDQRAAPHWLYAAIPRATPRGRTCRLPWRMTGGLSARPSCGESNRR